MFVREHTGFDSSGQDIANKIINIRTLQIAILGRESGGGLGVVFILVADGHRAHVATAAAAAARVDVVLSHGAAAADAAVGVISNRCREE